METLFIYLLKASALIAAYFLAYHFLLRKETFFTTNRWFLLAGMLTSVIMPLLFIKKIVLVEKPKVAIDQLAQYTDYSSVSAQETASIDWFQFTAIGYMIIAIILFIKIVTHLISLFKLLHKKEVVKKERFSLIDLREDIAPFSFFYYIVYNSTYYTNDELHSILLHEKIHSREKHSIDVLLAKLFCIVFWFNPFMWLYKKAITQNLEYIADQKAVQHIEDKKVYQKALLKVVTHQNCLSITNHFYQSLIKKRIVMLNKNQSKKSNSWKYALVLPVLVAFVIFFQVKVIAQEKESKQDFNQQVKQNSVDVIQITKNTSDDELKSKKEDLKSNYDVTAKFSKVKRNNRGELTSIKVDIKTPKGQANTYQFSGDEPIKPFSIVVNKNENGIVNVDFNSNSRLGERHSNDGEDEDFDFSFSDGDDIVAIEAPEPPVPPISAIEMADIEAPEASELPEFPKTPKLNHRKIVIKRNGAKEEVWINGKKVAEDVEGSFDSDDFGNAYVYDTKGPKGPKGLKGPKDFNTDEEIEVFNENNDQITIISKGKNGKKRVECIDVRKEVENARAQVERSRPVIERARRQAEETQREAMEAHKEAMEAHKEAMKDREEAMREARKDREEALKDAQEAREEALKEVQKIRQDSEKNKRNK